MFLAIISLKNEKKKKSDNHHYCWTRTKKKLFVKFMTILFVHNSIRMATHSKLNLQIPMPAG